MKKIAAMFFTVLITSNTFAAPIWYCDQATQNDEYDFDSFLVTISNNSDQGANDYSATVVRYNNDAGTNQTVAVYPHVSSYSLIGGLPTFHDKNGKFKLTVSTSKKGNLLAALNAGQYKGKNIPFSLTALQCTPPSGFVHHNQ